MQLNNNFQLIGRLGSDPEVINGNSATPIVKLSVAVSHKFTDQQGNAQEKTDWFLISCFGGLGAHVSKYLVKGAQIAVSGRMSNRSYTAQDGSTRYTVDFIASDVLFLTKPKTQENA